MEKCSFTNARNMFFDQVLNSVLGYYMQKFLVQ